MQPTGQRLRLADAGRITGQDEKCRLKRVFDVMFTPQDSPADAQHKPAMPANQLGESRFISQPDIPPQPLRITDPLLRVAVFPGRRRGGLRRRVIHSDGHLPQYSQTWSWFRARIIGR